MKYNLLAGDIIKVSAARGHPEPIERFAQSIFFVVFKLPDIDFKTSK